MEPVTLKEVCEAIDRVDSTSFGMADKQNTHNRARMLYNLGYFRPVAVTTKGQTAKYSPEAVAAIRVIMKAHQMGHSRSFCQLLQLALQPQGSAPTKPLLGEFVNDIADQKSVLVKVQARYADWPTGNDIDVAVGPAEKVSLAETLESLNDPEKANWVLVVFPVTSLVRPVWVELGLLVN